MYMIHQTKGIVLHRIKYSDSSIIANVYTEKLGLQSYIIYASKSKNSKIKINLLQPFYILDMQVYHKETGNLQKIKEFSLASHFHSISSDIKKNTVSLFLSEILNKVLKESDADKHLFSFLQSSITILDLTTNSIANFHIVFLIKLCKFLGIEPDSNFSPVKQVFDMKAGKFITGRPAHPYYFSQELSNYFQKMISLSINNTHSLKPEKKKTTELLYKILDYYKIHLDTPKKINSLPILREVFA